MEQIGIVKELRGNMAVVSVNRVSACGENCAQCKGGCTPSAAITRAENAAGASVGDTVKVESDTGKVIFAAFMLYIVPLLFAILAAIVVSCFTPKLGPLLIVTVNVFLGAILAVKSMDKIIAPKTTVTKIIKSKQL